MNKQKKFNQQNSKLILEELEERRLFSGGIEGLISTDLDSDEQAIYADLDTSKTQTDSTNDQTSASAAEEQTQEIVFVDEGVDNYQQLVDDIRNNADSSRNIEVVVLDRDQDGIEAISEFLQDRDDLDAIHIISHGSEGSVQLGNNSLTSETLEDNNLKIALWANSFAETGDILIYGCNLAASEAGQSLIADLGALTLTDVAASDDLTGHASMGGDWDLELSVGSIEATVAVSTEAQTSYQSLLDSGTAVWSDGSSTPQTSDWDGNSFGATAGTDALTDRYRTMQGADAPARDEKIVVGVDNSGNVSGEMWDGSSWSALPLSMGTVSETYWYGADVAYEQQSGDALVVWNDNSQSAGDKLRFAVWDGSSWSAAQSITAYTGTEPQNLRLAFDPGSDTLALVVNDVNADDHVMVWDGSGWTGALTLDTSGTAESDQSAIAVAFEAQSGDAMVTYGIDGSSSVYYRMWDGSSWSAEASIPAATGVTGDAAWLTTATDYNSDRIALATMTRAGEVWLNVWDGSAWETSEPAETGTTGTIYPNFGVAFESSSGQALAVYGESGSSIVKYRIWDSASGWSAEQNGPDLGALPNSMTLDAAPASDDIMLSVQDANSDLHYVLWNGSTWGTDNVLTTNTSEVKNQPFAFIYDQNGLLVDPNAAPVNTIPSTQNTAVNTQLVLNTANGNLISVTDTDDASLQVTLSATNGILTLNGTAGLSFSLGDGSSDTDMTFTGTQAAINAALDGLRFDPDAAFEGFAGIQIVTTDFGGGGAGGAKSDTDTVTIEVGDVNTAPVNTVPAAQTIEQDGMLLFSSATGTAITVSDVDAGGAAIQVTLDATNGTLNLQSTGGLLFSVGDGSDDTTMSFTGTIADINAALEGMTFVATSRFHRRGRRADHDQRPGQHRRRWRAERYRQPGHHVRGSGSHLWMTFENDESSTGNSRYFRILPAVTWSTSAVP